MISINFFGDFKSDDVSSLSIGSSLADLIGNADINVLNFEAPVKVTGAKPIEKNGPNICNDTSAPAFLLKAGFNLFSLANNHICDYGIESLNNTISSFPKGQVVGAGTWEEAYKPVILEVKGVRIAFLAVTHHEFGVLYEKAYQDQEVGAAWMLHPVVDEIVVETKKECDFLFVISHCGLEHEYFPMPEVRTLYRHWINQGADGVIASHAHTPQPWEIFRGKPIAYNLGNFCFDILPGQMPQPFWYWGLVASITINKGELEFEVNYVNYNQQNSIIKIVSDNSMFNEHIAKLLDDYNEEYIYIQRVNKQCLKYQNEYERLLKEAGFYRNKPYVMVKQLVKYIIGKNQIRKRVALQNLLECETHRWSIQRIIKSKG